jgi:hypothetical protein
MDHATGHRPPSVHDLPGRALGIWAFVLSFFLPVVALVLGVVALGQSRRAGVSNSLAIAAIAINTVAIVTGTVLAIVFS